MDKYKITTNREPLNKQDIDQHMNFDKFYSGLSAAKTSWWLASTKLYLSISIAVIAIAVASYFYISKPSQNNSSLQAFIVPPIPALSPDPDKFFINSERDTTINYTSGTSIYIPANIFKTKAGKNVKGPVEIRYTEFHDQVDQIFSGIPMNYDSAGVHSQFESAGMFDLMAYQNGEVLTLKDSKELTVEMISYNDNNNFNVYYLDTVQRKWLHDDKNTRSTRKTLAKANDPNFVSEKTILAHQAFVVPRKADPNLNNFTIDYNKDEFPELAVYDGVKFEVEKSEKNYDPKLANTTWEDIAVRRYTDDSHYVITVKAGKKSNSFVASPVFDAKDFDAAFKQYELKRLHREKMIARATDSLSKLDVNYTYEAKIKNDNTNARFENYVQRGWTYRVIVIGRMGRWNCDHPIRLETLANYKMKENNKGAFYRAQFESAENNEKLSISKIFLLSRTLNTIFPVSESEFKNFPVKYASSSSDAILGISHDNKIFYIMDEELEGTVAAGEEITYKLKEFKHLNLSEEKIRANNFKEIRDILKI